MTIKEIVQLGDKVLRTRAIKIEKLNQISKQLATDLMETMLAAEGIGIAGPQIGKSLRMFIVASKPNARYPNAEYMDPIVIINPTILKHSRKIYYDWEGCLSIPGIRGYVPRWQWIEAEYTTLDGKTKKIKWEGLKGRIFQHENDHLNGVVFLDRVDSMQDIITDKEYFKLLDTTNETSKSKKGTIRNKKRSSNTVH